MTEVNRKETISFFSTDMRKIVRLTRKGVQVLLEVTPFVVDPTEGFPPGVKLPTALFEYFSEENMRNAENPGQVMFPAEILSHPDFLNFIEAKP